MLKIVVKSNRKIKRDDNRDLKTILCGCLLIKTKKGKLQFLLFSIQSIVAAAVIIRTLASGLLYKIWSD